MGKQNRFITFVVFVCFFFSTFVTPVFAWVNNRSNGVTAIGIGYLDQVEVGAPEGDYFGIGSMSIEWRDLEPEEGKFNWGLLKPSWEMVPNTGGSLDTTKSPPVLNFVGWSGYSAKHLCELHANSTTNCKDPNTFTDPVEKTKCINHQRSDCMDPDLFVIPQPVQGYQLLANANRGKKVRLKIGVTDGALPLWMLGNDTVKSQGAKETSLGMGPNGNGIYNPIQGTTVCAYKTMQQGDSNNPDCHPNTDINTAVTYPSYPYHEDQTQPVWWNPIFQEKYKNMLKKVAEKVESDPEMVKAIDFVEATVGNFGEMILYGKNETWWPFCSNDSVLPTGPDECWCTQQNHDQGKCRDDQMKNADGSQNKTNLFCTYEYRKPEANHAPMGVNLWLRAGYTNKKYYDSIMSILSAFEEYFQKIPIAISKGTGLYSGDPYIYRNNCTTIATDDIDHYPYRMSDWVIPDAIERWGARMYLKFAGFPEGEVQTFKTNCPSKTKCIYETFGGISQWVVDGTTFPFGAANSTESYTRFWNVMYRANQAHVSALMMWKSDFNLINTYPNLKTALRDVANYIGPQITLNGGEGGITLASNTIKAGTNLGIKAPWSNVSYVSLWKTKRVPSVGIQHGQTFSTTKDLIVSNPIYIDLVNGNGQIVYKTTYIPTNGTQNWVMTNPSEHISDDQVFIPWSVPPGTYTLRIGLPINDALTKFWRFNGLTASTTDGIYMTGKTITVQSPTTTGVSFKPGWNFITWPSGVQLTGNQLSEIWSSCSMKSNLFFGNTIINNFSVLPTTLTSGTTYFINCQKSLW